MSKAQGQFTIVDLNDAVTLTGFINSNLAKTQMYNPDNDTYTPDWSTTNLVLTPSIYVAGTSTDKITSTEVISVKWYEGQQHDSDHQRRQLCAERRQVPHPDGQGQCDGRPTRKGLPGRDPVQGSCYRIDHDVQDIDQLQPRGQRQRYHRPLGHDAKWQYLQEWPDGQFDRYSAAVARICCGYDQCHVSVVPDGLICRHRSGRRNRLEKAGQCQRSVQWRHHVNADDLCRAGRFFRSVQVRGQGYRFGVSNLQSDIL